MFIKIQAQTIQIQVCAQAVSDSQSLSYVTSGLTPLTGNWEINKDDQEQSVICDITCILINRDKDVVY